MQPILEYTDYRGRKQHLILGNGLEKQVCVFCHLCVVSLVFLFHLVFLAYAFYITLSIVTMFGYTGHKNTLKSAQ